jgi:TldD protein
VLDLVQAELTRFVDALAGQPEPPYWAGVGVVDMAVVDVEATHGSASVVRRRLDRVGDVDVRIGSPELDNTHKLRDAGWFSEELRPTVDLPLGLEPPRAFRQGLWAALDESYRSGVRRLIKVRTNQSVKVAREDQSADFSAAPTVVDLGAWSPVAVDGGDWQQRVRQASRAVLRFPHVTDSNVSIRLSDDLHRFVATDGTRLRQQRTRARAAVWAGGVADDGMNLQVYDWVDTSDPARIPDADGLSAMAEQAAARVEELRRAPLVDPYVGPAILRGRAAAVFFHEVLGHRVEGHRQKDEDEGQTFTDKVGQAVLPPFLSVVDDPTIARIGEVDLNGHYRYDDEGVAAQRVSVVDRGVFRGFLMGRSPIEGFAVSNGHGRRQPGSAPVSRQGNLIVQASKTVSYAELRRQLVALMVQQGKPWGLIFDDISGGFTFTGRVTPNAFNVRPVTVWRVWPDGRPDELVRGVDLIGTPLTTFSRVLAASDQVDVFNGMCGAESGWVPVSAVAPDLLVSEVEVQRSEKANDRPPLLPAPGAPGAPS